MANLSDSVDFPQSPPSAGSNPGVSSASSRPISFNIAAESTIKSPGRITPAQVSPFPVQSQASQLPLLPRRKRPTFSRHRHDANPALAVKVLQDIQMAVDAWHSDLKQTVQRIQALYMEGPIVDGWLEAVDDQPYSPQAQAAMDAALLRHGDPQALAGYVDRLCESLDSQAESGPPPGLASPPGKSPNYRLCNLDSDGRLQAFPCPPEQLSTLSLAIARHQKLRQLIDHKQYLEAKLKRAVEVLTTSRDALGIAPATTSEPEAELD